jgi:Zn-dependent M16 (insulinase) family peptidase
VEQLILGVLEEVAAKGADPDMVEAVLHQLELSQREIGGDGFPYGLQLMVHALPPAIHHADPVAALDIDPVLNRLRERIKDPDFIKGLARSLLENRHRVRLVLQPDPELAERRAREEADRLAEIKAGLTEAQKAEVIEQAAALAERQLNRDDPEVLPKVGLEDIPTDLAIPEGEGSEVAGMPATWYAQGTNGLVYQELVVDLPELEPELADMLPLLCDVLTEVGSGDRDYLTTQSLQAAVTGGLGTRATVRGAVDDVARTRGIFVLSGKALERNQAPLTDLIEETFATARFDELRRLRELVAEERLRQEQSVTSNGHLLAMTAAASALGPSALLAHRWQGLEGLRLLKALDDSLDEEQTLAEIAGRLEQLRDRLLQAPRQVLLIGESEQRDPLHEALRRRWNEREAPPAAAPFVPPAPEGRIQHAWTTNTQVNFCARAYRAVAADHPDAPALMVLGGFLRNGYLHRAIREQGGAYGGGANFDPDSGAFRFFSYRDPRLAETLADFDRSLEWLVEEDHEWRHVEEAILGVIGAIDKPASPAGEAKKAFYGTLHGRTPEQRRRLRARVLEVRQEDLKRVVETYLRPEEAHTAVITDATTLEKHGDLGLTPVRL